MDPPDGFEPGAECAVYRPEGRVTFESAIELLISAITFAREKEIRRLLVDATRLTHLPILSAEERFVLGDRGARAAQAAVKVAIFAPAEQLDPERFGELVARNRGLFLASFPSEAEARAWLLDPNAE